jgi:predicted outer membrane repeat protein
MASTPGTRGGLSGGAVRNKEAKQDLGPPEQIMPRLFARHRMLSLVFVFVSLRPARGDELLVGATERYKTIQEAIDASSNGDVIRVGAGKYAEAIDFKGKEIVVTATAGAEATTIDAGAVKVPAVLFKTSETGKTVLENFTITNGTGTGSPTAGGGIYILNAAPTIRGCKITKNTAIKGGGVFIQGILTVGTTYFGATLEDCEISENTSLPSAGVAGGGLHVLLSGTGAAEVAIRRTIISKNFVRTQSSACQGGGAYIAGTNTKGKVTLTDCVVTENVMGATAENTTSTNGEGGGLYLSTVAIVIDGGEVSSNLALSGGGICLYNQGLTSSMSDLLIQGNTALGAGGGGGIYLPASTTSRLTLKNVTISGNTAGSAGGGGMLINAGGPILQSCKFIGNTSGESGGAIRSVQTIKAKYDATLFLANTAAVAGGAIYISSSTTAACNYSNCIFAGNKCPSGGAGIMNKIGTAYAQKFFFCTFYGNETTSGVGGFQFFDAASAAILANCILWGNKPNDYDPTASKATMITYSDVGIPALTGDGMINEDPLFVKPTQDPPDLHLQLASAAIDAGGGTDAEMKSIVADFDGNPRVATAEEPLDMGAYEFNKNPVVKQKFVRGVCRHPQVKGWSYGGITIADAIYLLRWRFAGYYPEPGCVKACDADDSGSIDLADATYILAYLFLDGPVPKAPFPELGFDVLGDDLPCATGITE